ncbi:MAG TPA: hypothetical protein VFP37_14960 [Steroidobacteraceae bacterium]|nr:hypothetical protein [Steroidobacteraceae bacterium]
MRISVRNRLTSRPPDVVRGRAGFFLALVFCFDFFFGLFPGFALAFFLAFLLAMTLMSPFGLDGPGTRLALVCLQTQAMGTDALHQHCSPFEGRT